MVNQTTPKISIVDYGMGNILNVKRACAAAGMDSGVTSHKSEILESDALILPGVGAFGDAMYMLQKMDLIPVLIDFINSGKPLLGICLGMQLLMSMSFEFGEHKGLNIIPGSVVIFDKLRDKSGRNLKVPQVQWNNIYRFKNQTSQDPWKGTILEGIKDYEYMYFVHSFYIIPDDFSVCVSQTRYGNIEFCSGLQYNNIFACQFHPEKSGSAGLMIFCNFKKKVMQNLKERSNSFVRKT
ncbi:MAG: imidazole glycerol phosphate synthase subunit HisH [Candidatus Omnitrophica bacterium]|nr:imidazole glycerol phosphate synthase subunit HisH [Candidatus Omnitrophota bacterium]MDD5352416.1 imidazole glycerol phosphate synthase subunit HisH [Candidatus Omnitrophota bacterium]MDD5550014.1 imidazole glycerol phosphate synthase subunit HisH [Candidatus Omnitrophota bacterium]